LAEGDGLSRADLSPRGKVPHNRDVSPRESDHSGGGIRSSEYCRRLCARNEERLRNFLAIAKGSLMETETFLSLATRLGFAREEEAASALELITEISKMLTALRSRLLQLLNQQTH
jgi:hypothetical protein